MVYSSEGRVGDDQFDFTKDKSSSGNTFFERNFSEKKKKEK